MIFEGLCKKYWVTADTLITASSLRDRVAHPVTLKVEDLEQLQQQLHAPGSQLGAVAAAVSALIVAAKKELGLL